MTREEADYIVVRYTRHIGGPVGRLNAAGLAGFDWVHGQMYFEYVPADRVLVCRDTGGGALEFHEPSRGIYLTRSYTDASRPFAQVAEELDRLGLAGEAWIQGTLRKILAAATP